IFGTGLSSPVEGFWAEAIELINSLNKKVIAVDIPSGLDASSGAVLGCAVKAGITVTMALPKIGLLLYPGRNYSGMVDVADIGIPAGLIDDERIRWNAADSALIRGMMRPRRADSHKGTYGHALILAGSPGKTGAAYMSAMGAMRVGTGLATIGLPESLNPIMEEKTTEVMTYPLPESSGQTIGRITEEVFNKVAEGKTSIVIGPGLGAGSEVFKLIETAIMKFRAPIVIDADGLNVLPGRLGLLKKAKADVILTPHPGEAARLLDVKTADVQADRIGAAERLSRLAGATVVLKGAGTVTACRDRSVFINTTGNSGLATAGTGDVLSGMIGGLLAQGYGAKAAAVISVYIHGLTADEVKKEVRGESGMVATDILARIPTVFNSFIQQASV
ncbi:MAG: NAD(P)H-hydrate dehydratase, partial [Deltaproteobacteria bacterium]|nr:NAD(P)H-hydrate dehydratase [Deltaproteobacteria bacterium]